MVIRETLDAYSTLCFGEKNIPFNILPRVSSGAEAFHTLYIFIVTMSANGIYLSVQHNHRERVSLLLHFSQALPVVLKGVIPTDVVKWEKYKYRDIERCLLKL